MKEIHAYLNEDGTYRIEGITTVYDTQNFMDAQVSISKAQVNIIPLPGAEKTYMNIAIPKVLEGIIKESAEAPDIEEA